MARGPAAGLQALDALAAEPALANYHLLPSVRGDLLVKLGRRAEAREELERDLDMTGDVLVTDGPYLEAKEHVGGFSILEAADMDEVLAWARKSVVASRMPVEVREIPYSNLPNGTAHPSRQQQKP